MEYMSSIDDCLGYLERSTMFHMSLGSKELFHSNFLHWMAEKYWDFFISVMHNLSEQKKFWWEDENGPNEKKYDPKNNNLKVLRENRNFDLSIYILDSEYETNDDDAEDDNLQDKKSKLKQIWIPVLILENKMKSLPYKEQLESYTKKAFEEWRRGRNIENINKQKQSAVDKKDYKWEPDRGITFILLSLLDSGLTSQDLENDQIVSFKRNNKEQQLHIPFKWESKTYRDLLDAFERPSICYMSDLDKLVFEDYSNFVKSLICIAEKDWKVEPGDNYIKKICPWASKDYQPDKQTLLRIDDIRQKIHYSQMQKMLMGKLEKELEGKQVSIKRVMAPSEVNKEKKEDEQFNKPIICCSTNFLHNVGLLEVYITHGKNLVGVQIQGNAYEHVFFDIEKKGKETYLKLKDEMENLDFFFEFNKTVDSLQTDRFPDFGCQRSMKISNRVSGRFKEGIGNNRFGYYKKSGVIYQKVYIPEDATIGDVLLAIVDDITNIMKILWQNYI